MLVRSDKHDNGARPHLPLGENRRYAWKERAYVVPSPSRARFKWKVSALKGLQRFHKTDIAGNPATIVAPALYNFMPAEGIALGWLNEIDALGAIRSRIVATGRITGWDVFTFHTRHNLDPYYASMIGAVRETWLNEGSLKATCVAETERRFGRPYDYNCVQARLVENLVFQSCLIDWLTVRAESTPLRFHIVGTALLSALVSMRSLSFESAVRTASKIGARWDDSVREVAEDQLKRSGGVLSAENLGWLRFNRVRQIMEGGALLPLGISGSDIPPVDAPSRPFWFSATSESEPVLVQTAVDVRSAFEYLNLASWAPSIPKPAPSESGDRIRGWLVSPLHPMASACRWSVYNYLLASPKTALLFLNNVATLGRLPRVLIQTDGAQKRLPLSRRNVTGP
jgi:hypothetical protein